MLTRTSAGFMTAGTLMGAWIDPQEAEKMKVTVITKRVYILGLFLSLAENEFHRQFGRALDIVKSGKDLPATAPE